MINTLQRINAPNMKAMEKYVIFVCSQDIMYTCTSLSALCMSLGIAQAKCGVCHLVKGGWFSSIISLSIIDVGEIFWNVERKIM